MITFYIVSIIVVLLYFLVEYTTLHHVINSIPIRILVNGTRGKSTTVKIIFDILKGNRQKVFAKITGDNPILIDSNGDETIVKRFAPASIVENIRILKKISKKRPDTVVLECMALQSETQYILAKLIFKPTHTIITNILPDHEEVMGKSLKENYFTISQCIYKDSIIYLSSETEQKMKDYSINLDNVKLAPDISNNFNLSNIPIDIVNDSWSIIKTLSSDLKLDLIVSLEKFTTAWTTIDNKIKLQIPNKNFTVWNLFSVNDILSLQNIINFNIKKLTEDHDKVFFLNCRADRPLRTIHFTQYIIDNFPEAGIWLTGNGKPLAKRYLIKENFNQQNIEYISQENALKNIQTGISKETHLFCIGNYKNMDTFISQVNQFSTLNGGQKSKCY
ncbi:MAG: hypothetical protein GY936_16575 [Ignavibacteriae bacterium]|nr:hypothetical protein [Ignavibacteriota bacterium]